MAEGDDRAAAEVFVGELAGAPEDDVEGTFQVAITDLFLRQVAIQEINRIALGDGLLPDAAGRVVARIG